LAVDKSAVGVGVIDNKFIDKGIMTEVSFASSSSPQLPAIGGGAFKQIPQACFINALNVSADGLTLHKIVNSFEPE
jgi:hypothetical protein